MSRLVRVLHIASGDLWAGAEVQAFTLMSHLAKLPETQVAAFLMNDGTLADKLRGAGIELNVINERALGAREIFGCVRSMMNSWCPDVVHTHREKENIIGALANRTARNVAAVRTMHGASEHSNAPGWRGVRRRMIEALDVWCGKALQDRIIAVTKDLAVQLEKEFRPEMIVTVENGVDVEAVSASTGIADFRCLSPQACHVGIVGRLVGVKRVDLFIETASLLSSEHPNQNWRFHVFGDGPLRPALEGLSRERGLSGNLEFHGHRSDIASCLAGLDVLVICSDHEGMPMTALEAAVLKTPTVAHAVGGLVDIVPERFLVKRHDPLGYRDRVLVALREDERKVAMDFSAQVLPRFLARKNAERIRALYAEVIMERRAAVRPFG